MEDFLAMECWGGGEGGRGTMNPFSSFFAFFPISVCTHNDLLETLNFFEQKMSMRLRIRTLARREIGVEVSPELTIEQVSDWKCPFFALEFSRTRRIILVFSLSRAPSHFLSFLRCVYLTWKCNLCDIQSFSEKKMNNWKQNNNYKNKKNEPYSPSLAAADAARGTNWTCCVEANFCAQRKCALPNKDDPRIRGCWQWWELHDKLSSFCALSR